MRRVTSKINDVEPVTVISAVAYTSLDFVLTNVIYGGVLLERPPDV
jgi:hypothetical protein